MCLLQRENKFILVPKTTKVTKQTITFKHLYVSSTFPWFIPSQLESKHIKTCIQTENVTSQDHREVVCGSEKTSLGLVQKRKRYLRASNQLHAMQRTVESGKCQQGVAEKRPRVPRHRTCLYLQYSTPLLTNKSTRAK